MAAVNFTCPRCAGVFQVPDSLAGQPVTCPHCRSRVALPAASPAARPIPLAPPPSAGAPPAGTDAVAVHTARPGAKERRRLMRNLVLWGFGLLIIGLVVAILSILGPIRTK